MITPAPRITVAALTTHFWTLNISTVAATRMPAMMPTSHTRRPKFKPIA